MRSLIGVLMWAAAFSALADSAYVVDKFSVPLRAAFAEGSPIVKNVDSGTTLDVLERNDKYLHVRDAQGAEGWIEARFVSAALPARLQLDRAQTETARLQKELTDAQARIKQLENAAQESARSAELSHAAETKAQSAETTDEADTGFPWGWLVLAFAMLWIGFGAG